MHNETEDHHCDGEMIPFFSDNVEIEADDALLLRRTPHQSNPLHIYKYTACSPICTILLQGHRLRERVRP